jgi:hypothetical protein
MIRGVYVRRSPSEKMRLQDVLKRYLKEIAPTKRPSTQRAKKMRAKPLTTQLGQYSWASALHPCCFFGVCSIGLYFSSVVRLITQYRRACSFALDGRTPVDLIVLRARNGRLSAVP